MTRAGFAVADDTGPDGSEGDFPEVIEACPESGELPSFTSTDGNNWDMQCGGLADGGGIPGWFGLLFVLVVLLGVGVTVWRVSTARRMARESGMNVSDATAMALMDEDGLSATYLASNLRPGVKAAPASGAPAAERLRELAGLLEQGLITQAEHDERRARIIDGV